MYETLLLRAIAVGFLLLLLVLSLREKPQKDSKGFFFANLKLSGRQVFFTFSASWIGAAALLMLSERAAKQGWQALYVMPLPTLAALLLLVLIRRPFAATGLLSLEDLLERSYGKGAARFASVVSLWYLVLALSSQGVALAKVGESFLKVPGPLFLLVVATVVSLYTALRGLGSLVKVNRFQLFFLVLSILGLAGITLGGASRESWRALASLPGPSPTVETLLIFLSLTLAWTVSPISLQRVRAAENNREAYGGLLGAALFLALFFAVVMVLGMVSGGSLLALTLPLSGRLLLFVLFLSALISTMDTMVNTASLSLSHLSPFSPGVNSFLVAWSSVLVALRVPSILTTLGLASEVMAEALFLPALAALLFPRLRLPRTGKLVMAAGLFLSLLSFSRHLLGFGLFPPWPYSLAFSLPFLLLLFVLSSLQELKGS
ncbi:MAG TPA: hypothetical protein PKW96_07705 [Candidatus Aminicenantes bacterium]|nr:hypothetical protein [Candidatus Aminicenantes bacterium]